MLRKAKALHLETLFVQKTQLLDAATLAYADHVAPLDYEQPDALLSIACQWHDVLPFGYVISMTENGLIPAAIVNDRFGLPGNSLETVTLLKDKWAMRRHLHAAGFSPVRAGIGRTIDDIDTFAAENGLPLIVKPVDGAGSFGIIAIRSDAEIPAAWDQVSRLGIDQFLIEEFLEGHEISVEAISAQGRHTVIAITDKLTLPNFVEIGHAMPAQIDEQLRAEVVTFVTRFLTTIGLKEGPSHTEIKLTADGPRIVESHNRVGGGKIVELVRQTYEIDMLSLALALPFGLATLPEDLRPARRGAAIRFFTPPAGTVRSVAGLDLVRQERALVEVELNLTAGSHMPPIRHSPDRPGHIVAVGPTVEEAVATCDRLVSMVQISVEEEGA